LWTEVEEGSSMATKDKRPKWPFPQHGKLTAHPRGAERHGFDPQAYLRGVLAPGNSIGAVPAGAVAGGRLSFVI